MGIEGLPRAGDVYRVVLHGKGHEQRGTRPMIVVQDDDAYVLSTRLCVPTSTSAIPAGWRVRVEVEGEDTLALVEQLSVISNERLERFLGRIPYSQMADIRTAAARLLGIIP